MEEKIKVIKLNEKEQKELFCAAWHLTNFIEDYKEGKLANFATPCETCKYQKECFKDENYIYPDAFSPFETLTKLTGVKISAAKGARKSSFSFFDEELIEDFQEHSSKQDSDHTYL